MEEKVLFENDLGTVTNKRLILNFKEGNEDIPVKQITSVAYEKRRNMTMTIINGAIAMFFVIVISQLKTVPGSVIIFGILAFVLFGAVAIAHYIGNYYIIISVAGNNRPAMKVEMAKTQDGYDLTYAIKQVLVHL